MNIGIKAATGDFICLTEDDIIMDRSYVAELVQFCRREDAVGLCGGIQYNQKAGTIRCAGGDFSLGPIFRNALIGADECDKGQFSAPFDVTWVPGSMIFSRTAFLQRLGGFREDFFMYFDDLELCARVRRLGLRTMVVPEAKAYHIDAPPAVRSGLTEFHATKNLFTVYLLHARLCVLPEFCLRYGVLALFRALATDRFRFDILLRAWSYVARNIIWLITQRRATAFTKRKGE
jgi:GT2 family glycosyltransferase